MNLTTGRVVAVRAQEIYAGRLSRMLYVTCPPQAVPAPGLYILAAAETDPMSRPLSLEPLAQPLFRGHAFSEIHPEIQGAGTAPGGFWTAPSIRALWPPGTRLRLRGPLGKGFVLPSAEGAPTGRHLAAVAIAGGYGRLLALVAEALAGGWEVALFGDAPVPADLPAAVEVHPLDSLKDALTWAGALAVTLKPVELSVLREALGLAPGVRLPCPGQVLVQSAVPCGGMASCGACSVRTRRGWRQACRDGPVFALDQLAW